MPPQDRGVGMVFQDYALYPSMKGKGNLAYYFQVHQRTEAEAEQRTREVAEIMGVGFDLLMGRVPTTLSGGEQQRVAIGRCIVRDPSLFLMDEPICNLDAKLRESTRLELKKLLRNFAITALYVTHDQQEAVFMGDRIAVMRDGRIEQIGHLRRALLHARQSLRRPVHRRAADRRDAGDHRRPASVDRRRELAAAGRSRRRAAAGAGADRRPAGGLAPGRGRRRGAARPAHRAHPDRARVVPLHRPWPERTSSSPLRSTIRRREQIRVSPDWERVYVFAADSEETLRAPGVARAVLGSER